VAPPRAITGPHAASDDTESVLAVTSRFARRSTRCDKKATPCGSRRTLLHGFHRCQADL